MNESLKSKIEAARQFAIEQLTKLDMDMKGATTAAAKLQARQEAFKQVLEWAGKDESK